MQEEITQVGQSAEALHGGGSFISYIIVGIQESVSRGDPWLILILTAGLFSVIFAVERFTSLRKVSINGDSLMSEIQKYLFASDLDGAIRVCNGAPDSSLAKVLKSGLQRASLDQAEVQNAIDATSLEQIPRLERNLSYIALIANLATLLGLLGTIAGLIRSFSATAAADPAQRQAMLSAGIAEAMVATALGLMVAIFSMILHMILANKATRITDEIDEYSVKLMDLLSARSRVAKDKA